MQTVVVLSGGMDSAVLLARYVKGGDSVCTISFNYGSKHNEREHQSAVALCEYYRVGNEYIRLPFIDNLFVSDLLKSGGDVPHGHYEDESMKRTVVPFRNTIMLSIAAGYAESVGAGTVAFGPHAGDHAIYPDCRPVFVGAMREVFRLGGYSHLHLEAPFLGMTKRQIALEGQKLAVPFDLTYSCYEGGDVHCGRCGTCVERKEALSGFDATEYLT